MVVGIDRGPLGQALKAVICADGCVDGGELLAEGNQKGLPCRRGPEPVLGLVVRTPPQGGLIFEKGGREIDAVGLGYWGEFTELLHLEDPGFQGFGSSACEGRRTIWLDTLNWGCCRRSGDGYDLRILLGDGLVLLVDDICL